MHPFELAISGFSGAGKTTLLEKLVPRLEPLRVGFLKSDAHRVSLDREGKDTQRLTAAGCIEVGIASQKLSALMVNGQLEMHEWKLRLAENDVVLLEGFRDSAIPKLLVLDAAGEAWRELGEGRFRSVRGLVHAGEVPSSSLPMFHRDDVSKIAAFVKAQWQARVPRVRGLVLSGGRSERMGADKAGMVYHDRNQAAWLFCQLEEMGLDPLVSRAPGQAPLEGVDPQKVVWDRFLGFGPLGGILSAMDDDPTAAWLVVGCDLPLLDRETLQTLLAARDPFGNATAFLDSDGRYPEPMLSLWEPKARLRALQFLALGYRCPRKVLLNSRVKLLASPGDRILLNANTPAQRQEALRLLPGAALCL